MRERETSAAAQIVLDFLRIYLHTLLGAALMFICRQSSVCHITLRYGKCVRTHVAPVGSQCAFFARQKARWTYSKGNPAKYRNDVREKIQSEKQVRARRI